MSSTGPAAGFSAAGWAKLDAKLREEIGRRASDAVSRLPVMVRVNRAGDDPSAGTNEEKQRRFAAASNALVEHMKDRGATSLQSFWLNWTLSADAPVAALAEIAERSEVTHILLMTRHKAVL